MEYILEMGLLSSTINLGIINEIIVILHAAYSMVNKLTSVADIDDVSGHFYVVGHKKSCDSYLNSVTNISVGKKFKMKRLTGSPPTSNNFSKS